MDVLIAGGHGQIARRLIRLLARDGHTARGLIRNPDHAADIEADGGVAGPVRPRARRRARRTSAARTRSCSRPAPARQRAPSASARSTSARAVKCVEAAEALGVARFVIVSSIGAHDPEGGPEAMRPYLRAKAEADARVAASTLDWTIVRPGSLEDEPGHRPRRRLDGARPPRPGAARRRRARARRDACRRRTRSGLTFELFAGDTPAREAVRGSGLAPWNTSPNTDVWTSHEENRRTPSRPPAPGPAEPRRSSRTCATRLVAHLYPAARGAAARRSARSASPPTRPTGTSRPSCAAPGCGR